MNHTYKFKALFFLLLVGLGFTTSLHSQIIEQPKWEYKFSTNEAKIGDVIEIVLTTTPPKNWYIYSTSIECEVGPIKATFEFERNSTFEVVGKFYSVGDKTEIDDIYKCKVGKFDKKAELRHKIKILSLNPVVKGFLEGQMCNNTSGQCVQLETPDFNFSGLKVKGEDIIVPVNPIDIKTGDTSTKNTQVQPNGDCSEYLRLLKKLDKLTGSQETEVEVSTFNTEPYVPTYLYKAKKAEEVGQCDPIKYEGDIAGIPKGSLFGFFLLAFISGLAALITPCVFPMIPMTVAFFMKGKESKSRNKSIKNGLLFGGSIIFIYTVLGSFFGIIFGPEAANWLATHWIPNIFFFSIFVFFAAAFFGAFELVLPSWLVNKVDKQADRGGMIGIFFMALTLALVSFSCTGPIVGVVIVESLSGEFVKPVIGMFGFSLAFALPFSLFAMFPNWLNSLPKSGGWLNSVKVTLGFLELALGLKFLSIVDQTYHWGILDREVYLALWIVIFTLLGVYLLGKLKFAHDSDVNFMRVPRLIFAICTFSFVIYLFPGMFGAPLKGLAGYLPPMSTHDFPILEKLTGPRGVVCEEPLYSSKLHLPHNLQGYFDYEQGMACAKKLNKPVFIDFTGHGCVNCREMEARVWSDERVLDLLSKEFIIIALYVDEKKIKLPEEEHYISKVTGRMVTDLAKKNSDIQVCMFGSNSQPNYVLLNNEEKLLNYPTQHDLNVENFITFLKTGVRNYKNQQRAKMGLEPLEEI